jgi:hypothetical protein
VFLSTKQSISAATFEKIQFDSEVYDSGNNFSTSSHDWTCPKDGLYMANLKIKFDGGANDQDRRALIGTATDPRPSNEGVVAREKSSDTGDSISVTTINKYAQGDTISGYAINANSDDALQSGSRNTRTLMEVAFLGGL